MAAAEAANSHKLKQQGAYLQQAAAEPVLEYLLTVSEKLPEQAEAALQAESAVLELLLRLYNPAAVLRQGLCPGLLLQQEQPVSVYFL